MLHQDAEVSTEVKIINEDILDEKEPMIYVQRYIYPNRTYQVFRKLSSEEEEFIVSDDIEQGLWCVSFLLTELYEPEADDELSEVFALVYLDEENPPVDDSEDCSEADPYVVVTYDREAQLYRCEPTLIVHSELETIAASTLLEAIEKGIATLDRLMAAGV